MNVTGSYQDLFNTDTSYDLLAGLVPNSVVVTDRDTLLQSEPLPDGSLLVGTASGVRGKALLGTTRQISVTNDADEIKLALPQDIDEEATPRFAGVHVDDFQIKNDPVFGLSVFDWSTGAGAVPLSILPADGILGSAVAIGTKFILHNDIDFLFGATKQSIHTAMPAADSKWTLPDLGLANLTFAALEASQRFTDETDSASTTTGSVAFAGGVGIAKSSHAANIATGALTVGGQAITPDSYVTTDTAQTITGKKLFTDDINIGTTQFGRLRFSTYGGGDSFIQGGYTTDADYFLEFYVRGVKAFEIRNGYPGSGRDREVTVPGSLTTGHVYPTVNDARNIGSESQRFGRLFLGNVQGSDTGTISLGHGIRATRRAELHLHSAGDHPSEIMFGVNARTDANTKWSLGVRESGTGDAFRLYRGTMLTGGAFVNVLDVIGSGANAGQFKLYTATDSVSTTTGSATFAGGVGIAKNLNAARVIIPRGTGAIDAKFVGAQPELFINSDGDGISQLSFGSGPAESANTKWAISSRASGNNEGLRVYRGPKLAGGAWDQIIQIDGTGADAGRVIFNKGDPSTSTTTGAVQIRGGLGVAGAIYAGSINVAAPDKRLLVSNAGAVGWSNSTFADTTSSTVLGTGAGYHQPVVPDPTGFDTYMANSNTVYGASAGYTTVKTVSRNTYIGERAGVGIGSHTNTAVGYRAFDTGTAPWNNLCHNNTAIGAYVMNTTATSGVFMSNNTAVGSHSMNDFVSGSANVAIGGASGAGFTAGNYCTFIGHAAGGTGGNRRIAIGADAKVTEDNHCRIGDSNITGLTLGSTNADIGKSNHRVRTIYTTNLDISGAITMPYYNGGFYLTNGLGTFNLYCPVHIVRLGRLTTVQISWASWFTVPSGPAWTLSGNAIPDGFRPFSFNSMTLPITNGGVEQAARFNVYVDGKVEIIPMPAGHFAVGQAGLSVFSFSFIAAA